jgi:hypothetical protein
MRNAATGLPHPLRLRRGGQLAGERALETPPELASDELPHLVEAAAFRVALFEAALSDARAELEELLLGLAARKSADPAADNS